MIRYRVEKHRGALGLPRRWKVVRIRGLERVTVSFWTGQALALDAALELAGLAQPQEATC